MNNAQLKSRTVRSSSGAVMMEVTLCDGDKILEQKVLSIDAFVALLTNATYKEDAPVTVHVAKTPEDFVDGFATDNDGTLGAIFYLPPAKHQFVLAGDKKHKRKAYFLPMPGLVYLVVFNQGSCRTFDCYAVKEWNGDDTVLFKYPFGNVSESGHVCMGTIKSGKVSRFDDLREFIEDSLNGETNSDYIGDNVRLAFEGSQYDFCEQIKDEGEFPSKLLLEFTTSDEKKTVGSLKKELMLIAKTL